MERRPVVSSNIVSIGYDPTSRTLEVEFKGSLQNRIYRYEPVVQEIYDALIGAPSVGRAYNELVKNNLTITVTEITAPLESEAQF